MSPPIFNDDWESLSAEDIIKGRARVTALMEKSENGSGTRRQFYPLIISLEATQDAIIDLNICLEGMPEVDGEDPAAEAANERRMRMIRARDRMRQVDAANRRKLRVLQVALEESWEVARILENSQYKEEVEPDLASARKEAEAAKKQKKAEKDDDNPGGSSKTAKRHRGQGYARGGAYGFSNGGFGPQTSGAWPYYIPQQYGIPQMSQQPISQAALASFFQGPSQPYQGYANQAVRQPALAPSVEAPAQSPPPPPPPSTGNSQQGAQASRRFACYVCGDPSHAMKNCPNRLPK